MNVFHTPTAMPDPHDCP